MKNKKSKAGAKKKPVEQVRQRVVVFIEQGKIDARGGMEKMKAHLYDCA